MPDNPLQSLSDYSSFVAELLTRPWYDDFPHPHDPTLASTHPHHKHIPPDIKHNRIPAPGLSFSLPNLLAIIEEIEEHLEIS